MTPHEQCRLSLCMIVRDSAKTLPACLESIRPWVDELVIVDTGSIDNTRMIAKAFGARVSDFSWVDSFSAARNESLRLASGDWLFWMDSDDTVDDRVGKRLRDLALGTHRDNTMGYVVQVHCPDPADLNGFIAVDHVKLIRNHPDIRFEGRVHEQLLPSIRRLSGMVEWTDLFVTHSGADHSHEGKARKYQRDLRLLHMEFEETPEHPFVLFNLGMTYSDMGDHLSAEGWIRRSLAVSSDGESHVRKAYSLLAHSLKELGRIDDAHRVCSDGLKLFPLDTELLFRNGTIAHELGNHDAAISDYQTILNSDEERHFESVDLGLRGFKTRNNLALVLQEAGRYKQAEVQWRTIIETTPAFEGAWQGLGRLLIQLEKWVSLDVLIGELEKQSHGQANRKWLEAIVAEKQGNVAAMRPLLESALLFDASHSLARQQYCKWLFEFGSLEDAKHALMELVTHEPNDAAAYHNLGMVHARCGEFEEATKALKHSLAIRPKAENTLRELAQLRSIGSGSLQGKSNSAPKTFHPNNSVAIENQSCRGIAFAPLDIVYLFRHSPNQDLEILYSLRSVAKNLPDVRKVWIFGDKPAFLTNYSTIAEHETQELLAEPLGFRTPVTNEFVMLFLASLIPDLSPMFVKFCDDYIVLGPQSRESLCTLRAMEDMNTIVTRGRGEFKDYLWRTYDVLKRFSYPGLSFEGHVPQPYWRRHVLEAFREFRDFVSEDRFYGMAGGTTVCNYAVYKHSQPFIWLDEEQSKIGFYNDCPSLNEIRRHCSRKSFLNFSDKAFSDSMNQYLEECFGEACKYEMAESNASGVIAGHDLCGSIEC